MRAKYALRRETKQTGLALLLSLHLYVQITRFSWISPIALALTPVLAASFWWKLYLEPAFDTYMGGGLGRILSYDIGEQFAAREVDFGEVMLIVANSNRSYD